MSTSKNFCAPLSPELFAQLEKLAAANSLKNKAALMQFLHANTVQNLAAKDAPTVLRCENTPYLLECYINAALKQSTPISKQGAQNYIAEKTGKDARAEKVNTATIERVLRYYLPEIIQHGETHQYSENVRFKALIAALQK